MSELKQVLDPLRTMLLDLATTSRKADMVCALVIEQFRQYESIEAKLEEAQILKEVFIVQAAVDYEGMSIVGCFLTKKEAEKYKDRCISFDAENDPPTVPDSEDDEIWAQHEAENKEYEAQHPADWKADNYYIHAIRVDEPQQVTLIKRGE